MLSQGWGGGGDWWVAQGLGVSQDTPQGSLRPAGHNRYRSQGGGREQVSQSRAERGAQEGEEPTVRVRVPERACVPIPGALRRDGHSSELRL